jgi:hypothetical protein
MQLLDLTHASCSLLVSQRQTDVAEHALKGSVGRRMQLFSEFAKPSYVPRPGRRVATESAVGSYIPAPDGNGPVEV